MNRRWRSKVCFKKTEQWGDPKIISKQRKYLSPRFHSMVPSIEYTFRLVLIFIFGFPYQQINEAQLQLVLISTWTLDLVKETNFVSPVETKQVRQVDLNWTCFSVHTKTERHDIVSFQFLVRFSVPPNFWTCFGADHLIFSIPM